MSYIDNKDAVYINNNKTSLCVLAKTANFNFPSGRDTLSECFLATLGVRERSYLTGFLRCAPPALLASPSHPHAPRKGIFNVATFLIHLQRFYFRENNNHI